MISCIFLFKFISNTESPKYLFISSLEFKQYKIKIKATDENLSIFAFLYFAKEYYGKKFLIKVPPVNGFLHLVVFGNEIGNPKNDLIAKYPKA